jgi:hypothetical protein
MASNDTVTRIELFFESKVFLAMHDELVELFEGSFIKQEFNPLTRCHLASFVLLFYASGATTLLSLHTSLAEDLQLGFRLFALLF